MLLDKIGFIIPPSLRRKLRMGLRSSINILEIA